MAARGSGTREDPWVLKTPPGSSEYTMYRDETSDPPALAELTHEKRNNKMRAT